MKTGAYILLILFLSVAGDAPSKDNEYQLSSLSEDYNTHYFYNCFFSQPIFKDTIQYVDSEVPSSFVVEIGALKDGKQSVLIYNDNKELHFENIQGKYLLNGKVIKGCSECLHKISLYFVNNKVILYFDEIKQEEFRLKYDSKKKVGIRWKKDGRLQYSFFNCYEPVAFKLADYGAAIEYGYVKKDGNVRMYPHNVGEPYNLSFPTDSTRKSARSIRFEYRYDNTKKEGVNSMCRARSEISGVFSRSPKNKWIIDFDMYVPEETIDDNELFECITQIHEGSKYPKPPSFCLKMKGGVLYSNIKGDSARIECWKKGNPTSNITSPLLYIEKNRWYHVKVYIKEGWIKDEQPITRVWVDGKLRFESDSVNCYRYSPKGRGYYDYLKFGIYKSYWMKAKAVDRKLHTRIYYFANYVVKY